MRVTVGHVNIYAVTTIAAFLRMLPVGCLKGEKQQDISI
jgi:hypothetical protein